VPTVLRWRGWRVHFYSADRIEPPHVHVSKGRQEAKLWLADCAVARARRCSVQEIAAIKEVIRANRAALLEAWHEHVGD
jgi:hypothetical protein